MKEYIEEMYWVFDGARKGYGEYKGRPSSEREAFKMVMGQALIEQHRRICKQIEDAEI